METYDRIRKKETEDLVESIFDKEADFLLIKSISKHRLAFLLLTLQKAVGRKNLVFTKPYLDKRVKPHLWTLKVELVIPKAVLRSVFKYNPPQSEEDEVEQ